jgi:hypothetical protein
MKTFLIKSNTNYGEVVHVINAKSRADVRKLADSIKGIWDGYEIEEIDTTTLKEFNELTSIYKRVSYCLWW